jgi:uncharacterized RDD family membrane protein YckC
MQPTRTCPQCQRPLRSDAPDGLCPECLMKVGLGSVPEPTGTIRIDDDAVRVRELPKPGTQFGGYRIVRELGRGGMGAVYEAEHLESGRRIALKVLSHQLDSMADRARFLREGRLAGSINHPNSVYVFGTEEIEDTPVIAMELIAGGTLQEHVQRSGPLAVGAAVDAILQVIAGLEAAQAIGILHRDIKPANCFEDADGTVKVGDFGLSISTAARGDTNLTMHGQFLGTPAFCSPEQLRGEELNVRSDMYSVGVTLFFLLTGRTPFEGKNMVQLLANVIEKPAPSPKQIRADVPQGLANAVLRCLQKQPGERFKSYDEFRQALAPFSSDAPVPAPLALRFVAGVTDHFLISGVSMVVGFLALGGMATYSNPDAYRSPKMLAMMAAGFVAWLLYYALLEGWRGASVGKMIFRLRVAGPDRNPPGVWKAFARAFLYLIPPVLPYWICFSFDSISSSPMKMGYSVSVISGLIYYAVLGLLFSTARHRNGLAAIHDLITGTRVIRKPAHQARPVLAASEDTPPVTEAKPKVGPFHVIETLEKAAEGEWLLGYDTRLLRKVWIHVVPPSTPPLAPSLRSLGRVGRLRWISGRRSVEENWDVFEGVTGAALLKLFPQPQSWAQVRYWLLDLATEISAAEKDGTRPAVLALDRVWITADGRAKLLDFPAPGLRSSGQPCPVVTRAGGKVVDMAVHDSGADVSTQQFLDHIARAALAGCDHAPAEPDKASLAAPLPLHARSFLKSLPSLPNVEAVAATLKPLLQRVTTVSRLRRAGLVAGCIAFPLVASVGLAAGMQVYKKWVQGQPEIGDLAQVLNIRAAMNMPFFRNNSHPDDRKFAIYIASHYRATITNTNEWATFYALSSINGKNRQFAEQSLVDHPNPTEKEINEVNTALKPLVSPRDGSAKVMFQPWFPFVVFIASLGIYVCLPALLAALLFRGGLILRGFGVAVARRDGTPASRGRVLWRSLIAWSPVWLPSVLLMLPLLLLTIRTSDRGPRPPEVLRAEPASPPVVVDVAETTPGAAMKVATANTNAPAPVLISARAPSRSPASIALVVGLLLTLIVVGLTLWSLVLPGRSLQDRIAGTWLVPR